MKTIHTFCILLILFVSCAKTVQAQDNAVLDSAAIYNMSLEQLMNIKSSGVSSELEALINSLIGVASKKPLSSRKSPSIVSLITQDEIEKSGARDLIDVLRLVPGIDFATDVQGVVGIGIRGNWAHEGKVLLLLDGQEMNEILYSSLQLGNHFDVSQIKRIEVIRGPGSAIYGGFAEYGVISIITKNGEDLNGIAANVSYGQMVKDYGQKDVSLSIGKKIKDLNFSLAGFFGEGQRSDRTYTDPGGQQYNMAGNSNLNPENLNLGLSWKNLSLRGIYDNYQTTDRSNLGTAMSQPYPNNFRSILVELKYDAKINDRLTITPRFNYTNQMPWNYSGIMAKADSLSSSLYYNKQAERYKGNVTTSWDVTKKINIIAGGEMYYDLANTGNDTLHFNNGKQTIDYTNSALFMQALWRNRIANLTLGARYDNNSGYGSAFVPRLGITKKISIFNFKLLYSQSFRAPGIENIEYSSSTGSIRPEQTQVVEFEVGYQPTSSMFLTLNIFDITTMYPIVYFVDTVNHNDGYKNLHQQGSQGAELDYRIKTGQGYLDFNYSFYTTAGKEVVSNYSVPGDNSMTLAFPANKFNVSASYTIYKSLSITPTLSWIGQRYGYVGDGNSGNIIHEFPPVVLANIFLSYKDLFTKGLNLGIGCYNILDADYSFIQPYNSGHPPLPAGSREFVFRISYNLHPKKHE